RFDFPNGGLEVTPGDLYSIRLRGGMTFGWKYVLYGYQRGSAWFNGRPLGNARSSFLFRTFGTGSSAVASPQARMPVPDRSSTGVFKIGNGVSAPTVLFKVEPGYSKQASKAGLEGTVILSLVVDEKGQPRDIKVLRGLGLGLDENAIE